MYERVIYITPHSTVEARDLIFDRIISASAWNDYSSILYLCPNQFAVKETLRDFLSFLKRMEKPTAFIPFRASTLYRLALSIHKERAITEDMRILILCDMLRDRNTGYPAQLSWLLKKIRHHIPNIEPSEFRERVKGLIFEEKAFKRLDEAITHLQRYSERIERIGLVDYEECLKDIATLDMPFYESLVIDGFYDPTPLETSVIKRVIENSGNVYISAEDGSGILNSLHDRGFKKILIKGDHQREDVVSNSYPSMEDEVEGIARRVKDLILQGLDPFRIVVTFPDLSKYLPMLRRVFKRYEIPISISGIALSDTFPLLALNDMFTSIENDYPRNEFLSFLTSPCFPEIHKVVREYAVTYSYMAEVIKGKKVWLSIKDIIMATSNDEIEAHEIERLSTFQKELTDVIRRLEDLKEKKGLLDFVNLLEKTLDGFGFFNYLKAMNKEIYAELMDAFSDLRRFAVFYQDVSFIDTPWFYLMQSLKNRTIENNDIGGVRILQYESSVCVKADMIFFGGLIEDDLPSKPPLDPYLPETVKRGLGMPDLEYYIERQKRYFKRLLNLTSREPYLSYPSSEGDRVFLPSPFLNWDRIRRYEDINIFSHEDILVYEGAIKGDDFDSVILWDGDFTDDMKTLHILKGRIDEFINGFINVTDLDLLRRCPLCFYIERILCLKPIEPIRFEVDAKLWGSIAHRTMEEFIKNNQKNIEAVLSCLEDVLNGFSIKGFWADVAREIFKRLLPTIRSIEAGLSGDGFMPFRLEERITGEVGGVRLKGKIDRVDIKSDIRGQTSENRHSNGAILLDYKTGGIDGDSLQLPLYAYMWQAMHNEPVMKTGFYSLRDGEIKWFPKKIEMDEFIHDATERVRELIERMRNGDFSTRPSGKGRCGFCYHRPLCRLSE